MNDTTRIAIECSAKTNTGKFVTLPAGTEIQATMKEIRAALNAPGAVEVQFLARCPRAKNPAPYTIDASDLWLAVNRY